MKFCPNCGHQLVVEEEAPIVETSPVEPAVAPVEIEEGSEPDPVAIAAIEAVAEVAEHALDTVSEMQREEEETERTEAVAEMVEAVAEEQAEAEQETEEQEPEGEPSPETVEGAGEEELGEPEHAQVEDVDLPPQVDDETVGPGRAGGGRRASAFRARRIKRRR